MKLLLRLEEKRNEENIFKVKKERLRIQEEGHQQNSYLLSIDREINIEETVSN